jgi:dTDP-4-dehydrorhamnose reductase
MENQWSSMKILVTGASGLYGSKVAQIAEKRHQVYSIHNKHSAPFGQPIQLDISNRENLVAEFQRIKPDTVIHAATLTDVDECELNRELARKINVEGTLNVAEAAEEINAFLLYISTDYVFDGENGNYKEEDQPSPINFYGYTKLLAEERIRKISSQFCIARTSVIYGTTPSAGKTNFALWLIDRLRNQQPTKIANDQWNSPTLNTNLAKMTLEVAERKLTGLYHLAGATRISRFNFALSIAMTLGLEQSLISPALSSEFRQTAKRPRDSSLNVQRAQEILSNKPMPIVEGLENLKSELRI